MATLYTVQYNAYMTIIECLYTLYIVQCLILLQVKSQVKGEIVKLKMPNVLSPDEFRQQLQPNIVQLLVTLSPLFMCLNK